MHICQYCGIEYDPAEAMCPACGYKNEKPISPPKETEKVHSKEEKKIVKEKSVLDKKEVKKDAFYKEALAKLEKSLVKKKVKEKKREPEKKKKEKVKVKKKSSGATPVAKGTPPFVKGIKKAVPGILHLFYTSRISYIIWFVTGMFAFSAVAGYWYGAVGWMQNTLTLLFTSDIAVEAELLNVHHGINDFNPISSFFVLQSDVLLFVPLCACFIPLGLWIVKKKFRGVNVAGNSNVFAGLILTLVSALFILFILRATTFDYFVYTIILAVVLCSTLLDLGILIHLYKPGDFQFGSTLVVFFYNIGIPIILIVISMAFDVISMLIS
jgi:uncharacterized Zn finger protein (UPF0148 family)